jgi:hypothetical protein
LDLHLAQPTIPIAATHCIAKLPIIITITTAATSMRADAPTAATAAAPDAAERPARLPPDDGEGDGNDDGGADASAFGATPRRGAPNRAEPRRGARAVFAQDAARTTTTATRTATTGARMAIQQRTGRRGVST